jgi:cytochrome c-type biogenesis protein CcmH/NrfG
MNHSRIIFSVAVMTTLYVSGALLCVSDRLLGYQIDANLPVPEVVNEQQFDQIVEPLRRDVQANLESAQAHYRLAAIYYYLDRYDLALGEVANSLLLDPYHPRAHYLLGLFRTIYKRPGVTDTGPLTILYTQTQFQTLKNQLGYGYTLFGSGFQNQGLKVLHDAVNRFPADAQARAALAAALFDSGHVQDAVAENEMAIRLSPNSIEIADQFRSMLTALKYSPDNIETLIQQLRSETPNLK